jgi:2-C-methyl-D-erythritol 4-phosphate cytidylyltransferase
MNVALITAAGTGERMGQDIPKQFLHVENKPIIIYTLEAFQAHPSIDYILVVCLDGWHEILKAYAKQFDITKLKWVVSGGSTGQESIYNGLKTLETECDKNDLILIHDGNRVMVSQDIISDSIAVTNAYGCAIPAIPCTETIVVLDDNIHSSKYIDKTVLKRTQTPHGFRYGKIMEMHNKAIEKNIRNKTSACEIMIELGEVICLSKGSEKNLKITTVDDIEIFKALLKTERDEYIKMKSP